MLATIATGGPFAAIWNGRLMQASADLVRQSSGARLLGVTLTAYAVLWLLYFSISNATVDIHSDVSEASVWARTFSLGYKHPPMMAWIFRAWLAVFPRTYWAAYLLAITNLAATLAITWVLLRDHLDKERALVGVTALILVPFYTFLASRLNANTVMMPFWAATVLFYLRARRNVRWTDAVLAGVFAGLTFLGKYWGVYLIAGIAVASFAGDDLKRFWRSGAPFLMAAAALVVLAPHIHWLLTEHDHPVENYMTATVMVSASFGSALKTSAFYLGGVISYVVMPLTFFAVLKPDRAAWRDTIWPTDSGRRQALLLLVVPLILPALVNLAWPHRLTAVWAKGAKSSIAAHAMVCIEGDVSCRAAADSLVGSSGSVSDITFAKTFLGYSSPPLTYRIVVAPISNRS